MRDELLEYYENELSFLRTMGAEFAQKYPTVASHLLLGPTGSEDPHVERLVEAFAFLAARVHLKIDDDFPEIVESFLNVLYPHYLRPIPSFSVVEFNVDNEQGKLTTNLRIARDSLLYSRPIDSVQCKFRTCYETVVSPLRVASASWRAPERLDPPIKAPEAVAACSIRLNCFPDVLFKPLALSELRFFLHGEGKDVYTLYELLFNNCLRILVRNPDDPKQRVIELPPDSLRAMGFRDDEAVLPYPKRSFTGYRLLQEYFTFPEKFLFMELANLSVLSTEVFKNKAEIIFLILPFERADRQQSLELNVNASTFKLGCTPIVNLFPVSAEPIMMEQIRFEYPVIPDARRRHAVEVFSIDNVRTSSPDRREVTQYEPFYSNQHGRTNRDQTFWNSTRRPSTREHDAGTEVFLSMVDTSGHAAKTGTETLNIRCTCTNRDLPARLPPLSEFELEGGSPVKRIVSLQKPSATLRPPLRRGLQWRLISHFSLNYLSLTEDGRGALQEILRLYNFTDEPALEKQIAGIIGLGSKRHFARVISEHGISFARGVRVNMEIDEEMFVGAGVFLFASVLEHFLAMYVSLNSFSQLIVRTRQRKEILREWQPRSGQKILL
ncbi:MAG TPA: type VI secretion system baseplate subunit TssF [Bryobacteraceae bacterium]|jgi:type VI secretion system protein ImpG|nr:type VI secretion system baseplate subunit TssF [Bryobacteraceae bacterium]